MTTVKEAFCANLRRAMAERNMSMIELGQKADISAETIRAYRPNKGAPTLRTAFILSRALGVTLDELVEGADET